MPINSRNKGKVGEEWKPVIGYEGLYEVSNYGRVRSLKRFSTNGRVLKLYKSRKNGYVYASLSKNNKRRTRRVHTMVMEAFTPYRSNGFNPDSVIDHLDCNKENNRLDNLEVVTQKENDRRAREYKLQKRLGNQQKTINLDTKRVYASYSEAARSVGGSQGEMVARVCRGERSHYRNAHFARYDDYINNTIPRFKGKNKKKASKSLWR